MALVVFLGPEKNRDTMRDNRAGVVLVRHGGVTEAPSSFAAWRFRLPFPNPRIWGGRGVNGGDAHPGLILGRGSSEREIEPPSSTQEMRRKVGGSGGCAARQGREEKVTGEVQGAVEGEEASL
jgi:hypothetical protein